MPTPTKATILKLVQGTLSLATSVQTAKLALETGYGSLTSCLNSALKSSAGQAHIKDALFALADDTSAAGGNPFHKLRVTLGTRCTPRYGVKSVVEDDELIDFTLTRKGKKSKKAKPDVDPDTAYDTLASWVEGKAKANPSFAKALLSFNANALRKAINDGARDAGIR